MGSLYGAHFREFLARLRDKSVAVRTAVAASCGVIMQTKAELAPLVAGACAGRGGDVEDAPVPSQLRGACVLSVLACGQPRRGGAGWGVCTVGASCLRARVCCT